MLYKLLRGRTRELSPFTLPLISSYREMVTHMTRTNGPSMGSVLKSIISIIATQNTAVVLELVQETESPGASAETQIGAPDWALLTNSQNLLMLLSREPHA